MVTKTSMPILTLYNYGVKRIDVNNTNFKHKENLEMRLVQFRYL